jgi:hypothetical protein
MNTLKEEKCYSQKDIKSFFTLRRAWVRADQYYTAHQYHYLKEFSPIGTCRFEKILSEDDFVSIL